MYPRIGIVRELLSVLAVRLLGSVREVEWSSPMSIKVGSYTFAVAVMSAAPPLMAASTASELGLCPAEGAVTP